MKVFLKFAGFWLSSFAIILGGVMLYISQLNLELGDKVGSGIFYLKGYYEEGDVIVTEQGVGLLTIPIVTSSLLTLIYFIIYIIKKSNSSNRVN